MVKLTFFWIYDAILTHFLPFLKGKQLRWQIPLDHSKPVKPLPQWPGESRSSLCRGLLDRPLAQVHRSSPSWRPLKAWPSPLWVFSEQLFSMSWWSLFNNDWFPPAAERWAASRSDNSEADDDWRRRKTNYSHHINSRWSTLPTIHPWSYFSISPSIMLLLCILTFYHHFDCFLMYLNHSRPMCRLQKDWLPFSNLSPTASYLLLRQGKPSAAVSPLKASKNRP